MQRSGLQAVGFYIAYLILTILLAILVSVALGSVLGRGDYNFGVRTGGYVAVIVTLVLAYKSLQEKKLLNNYKFILLLILSGILAFFGGGLLGLIPVAYITTARNAK